MPSSVRLSVRPSVTRVDQSKTVELIGGHAIFNDGVKQGWVGRWGNKLFSNFMRQYLENGTRYDQSYY